MQLDATYILITGSRSIDDRELIAEVIASHPDAEQLFIGDAKGVDRIATEEWVRLRGTEPNVFTAQWGKHGKGAGPIRNIEMIEAFVTAACEGELEGHTAVVYAFWDGESRGTAHCANHAAGVGLPVWWIRREGDGDVETSLWEYRERMPYGVAG